MDIKRKEEGEGRGKEGGKDRKQNRGRGWNRMGRRKGEYKREKVGKYRYEKQVRKKRWEKKVGGVYLLSLE